MAENEFPTEAVALTLLLVVSDMDRSIHFYRDVLGAIVYREFGGTSCVLSFQGTWLLLVTGGGPTKDKPGVTFAPPTDPDTVSHELTIRVPDCQLTGAERSDAFSEIQTAIYLRSVRLNRHLYT